MTPKNILFLLACVFSCLALLLVYNGFYRPPTVNAANDIGTLAPS